MGHGGGMTEGPGVEGQTQQGAVPHPPGMPPRESSRGQKSLGLLSTNSDIAASLGTQGVVLGCFEEQRLDPSCSPSSNQLHKTQELHSDASQFFFAPKMSLILFNSICH